VDDSLGAFASAVYSIAVSSGEKHKLENVAKIGLEGALRVRQNNSNHLHRMDRVGSLSLG
jgi:hypothetical protein